MICWIYGCGDYCKKYFLKLTFLSMIKNEWAVDVLILIGALLDNMTFITYSIKVSSEKHEKWKLEARWCKAFIESFLTLSENSSQFKNVAIILWIMVQASYLRVCLLLYSY